MIDLGYMIWTSSGWLVLQYQHWKWMDRAMAEAHKILEKYKDTGDDIDNLLPISRANRSVGGQPPWLTYYKVGDVFLTKGHAGPTVWYDEVTVDKIVDGFYYLLTTRALDMKFQAWADVKEYSHKFVFVKLLNRKKDNG